MNRSLFILLLLWVSLCYSSNPFEPDSSSIRGIWIVRNNLTTPEKIDSVLALCEAFQFTDLFVQVRGRGDAYYQSAYEPRSDKIPDQTFDPLGYLLSRAENLPFRIHAWINVFYVWSADTTPENGKHLINGRLDWLARPVGGEASGAENLSPVLRGGSEGYYLSPLLPEVQKFLLKIVDDLLSHYAVDGLHLDYVRFPNRNFDFHPRVRKDFKKRYVLDPFQWKSNPEQFVQLYGQSGYELYYYNWARFLRDGLSDFIRRLADHVHNRYPGIILSAAVKADLVRAHWDYYQHWDRWVKEGWLDLAIPMNYEPRQKIFVERISKMLEIVEPGKMAMGISLYNQPADSAVQKMMLVAGLPVRGMVLFSYDQFKQNDNLQSLFNSMILKMEKSP